jgi:hypothetical protein
MMKARFTVALVLTAGLAGLVLSACSGETTSTPSASVSSAPVNREASLSNTHPFSVENQLKDWWGGPGIPVTWKVSETDNSDWDGSSRPDHAPPNGFQGLVQKPFSGVYNVDLEVNGAMFTGDSRFVLTPVVTIDGQTIDLQPIVVNAGGNLVTAGISCQAPVTGTEYRSATASLSAKTPRELLMYDVVLFCYPYDDSFKQRILIRNYQKS